MYFWFYHDFNGSREAAQNLFDELRMWEGKHKKEAIQGKDWDYV